MTPKLQNIFRVNMKRDLIKFSRCDVFPKNFSRRGKCTLILRRSSHPPPQTWLAATHKDYNGAHLPRRGAAADLNPEHKAPLHSTAVELGRSVGRSQQRARKASKDRNTLLKVTKAATRRDAGGAAAMPCRLITFKLPADGVAPRVAVEGEKNNKR